MLHAEIPESDQSKKHSYPLPPAIQKRHDVLSNLQ